MNKAKVVLFCLLALLVLSAGPKGDTGATGPRGPQGNRGPAGPQGKAGVCKTQNVTKLEKRVVTLEKLLKSKTIVIGVRGSG